MILSFEKCTFAEIRVVCGYLTYFCFQFLKVFIN